MPYFILFLNVLFPYIAYAQEASNSAETSNNSVIIFVVIALYCVLVIIGFIWKHRCPECKKWWAMKEEKRILLDAEMETKIEKKDIKNKEGSIIGTEEIEIPVLVKRFEVWKKCKHCSHLKKEIVEEREKHGA